MEEAFGLLQTLLLVVVIFIFREIYANESYCMNWEKCILCGVI